MANSTSVTDSKPLKIIVAADEFGYSLKDSLVSHLRSINVEVEDLGTSSYNCIAPEIGRRVSAASSPHVRGLLACGTGVGVSIFANKYPGVYAATCLTPGEAANSRSIKTCNVLSVPGMQTSPETAVEILNTWLKTPFKDPCPAPNMEPRSEKLASFSDKSLNEKSEIGGEESQKSVEVETCALCSFAKNRKLEPIDIPGGAMKIVMNSPTSAFFSFKAGSVEPAHHHSFGHEMLLRKGSNSVYNLTKKTKYNLGPDDYLFTPAGEVHRVKYHEDTDYFLKWEGQWDTFNNEDLLSANHAVDTEADGDFQLVECP